MKTYPPKPANCELTLLQNLDMMSVYGLSSGNGSEWEVIGMVTLAKFDEQDPSSEENKALVRSRACAMGGEAITTTSTSSQVPGTTAKDVNLASYTVLRKRTNAAVEAKSF